MVVVGGKSERKFAGNRFLSKVIIVGRRWRAVDGQVGELFGVWQNECAAGLCNGDGLNELFERLDAALLPFGRADLGHGGDEEVGLDGKMRFVSRALKDKVGEWKVLITQ